MALPDFYHPMWYINKYLAECHARQPPEQTDDQPPPLNGVPFKKCGNECGRWLPATTDYFYTNKSGLHGVGSMCKQCKLKRDQSRRVAPVKRHYLSMAAER